MLDILFNMLKTYKLKWNCNKYITDQSEMIFSRNRDQICALREMFIFSKSWNNYIRQSLWAWRRILYLWFLLNKPWYKNKSYYYDFSNHRKWFPERPFCLFSHMILKLFVMFFGKLTPRKNNNSFNRNWKNYVAGNFLKDKIKLIFYMITKKD
jgi:hypothetical protein